jgi:hypothetical protein
MKKAFFRTLCPEPVVSASESMRFVVSKSCVKA